MNSETPDKPVQFIGKLLQLTQAKHVAWVAAEYKGTTSYMAEIAGRQISLSNCPRGPTRLLAHQRPRD